MEAPFYPIVVVPEDSRQKDEPLGSKPKHWYQNFDSSWHIFKQARPGEDWSEKVACEISALLGLPHAHVDLASFGQVKGVSSPSFVPAGASLIHGNELLSDRIPDYPLEQRWGVSKHSLDNVLRALSEASPVAPMGYQNQHNLGWQEIFCGYLLLDALIGNTDRHHENWALVRLKDADYLAPSYDHAASLGRNESDTSRAARLTTNDSGYTVQSYANRARSAFYLNEHASRPMATLETFAEALKQIPAGRVWFDSLQRVSRDQLIHILDRVPNQRISTVARAFALELLLHNRERILNL